MHYQGKQYNIRLKNVSKQTEDGISYAEAESVSVKLNKKAIKPDADFMTHILDHALDEHLKRKSTE